MTTETDCSGLQAKLDAIAAPSKLVSRETLNHLLDWHEFTARWIYLGEYDPNDAPLTEDQACALLTVYRTLGREPLEEDYALRCCPICGYPLAGRDTDDAKQRHYKCVGDKPE